MLTAEPADLSAHRTRTNVRPVPSPRPSTVTASSR